MFEFNQYQPKFRMNREEKYLIWVCFMGLLVFLYSTYQMSLERHLIVPYILMLLLSIGYRLLRARLLHGLYISFTPLLLFTGLLLLGIGPTVTLFVIASLLLPLFGAYYVAALFNASQFIIALYACYFVYGILGGDIPLTRPDELPQAKLFLGTMAFTVVNVSLVYGSYLFKRPRHLTSLLPDMIWEVVVWALSTSLCILIIFMKYHYQMGVSVALILLAPTLALCYLSMRMMENQFSGRQLSQLIEFITRLSAPLHSEKILGTFFEGLSSVVNYDCCAIWESQPDGKLRLLHSEGDPPLLNPEKAESVFQTARAKGYVLGRWFHSQVPRNRLLVQLMPIRYLVVSMIYGNKVQGMLHLEHRNPHMYNPTEIKLVSLIAENLAVALQQSHLIEEIQSTKDYLLNILTSSHIAIVVTDQNQRVRIFNTGAAHLTGYEEHEVMERPIAQFFHPDDYRRIRRLMIRKGKIEDLESEVLTAQGHTLPISLSASVLHDGTGKVVGAIGLIYNIAHRKLLQNQIIQNEKLAALGRLITGVTHEINNRLTPILGYTQLLRRTQLLPEHRAPILAIEKSAEGANSIVRSLLSFSRPNEPQMESNNLNETVHTVLHLLEIDSQSIMIRLQLDPDLPNIIYDRHQIEQVLLNLLKNSLQALNRSGGIILIKTYSNGGKVWVVVRDDGPGMSEKILSRVFDPFFTTKAVGHGVGLGLSLCYSIIQAHHGAIQIQSRQGRGTEVSFWLPQKECPLPKQKVEETAPPLDKPVGKKIFVVDDEESIRNLLHDVLANNYEVKVFSGGKEVLEAMQQEDFDLCICDLRMPEMDGIEVHQWVCENLADRREDFVFITGDTFGPAAQSFLERVNLKYLCKPFSIVQIEALVVEHFTEHSLM